METYQVERKRLNLHEKRLNKLRRLEERIWRNSPTPKQRCGILLGILSSITLLIIFCFFVGSSKIQFPQNMLYCILVFSVGFYLGAWFVPHHSWLEVLYDSLASYKVLNKEAYRIFQGQIKNTENYEIIRIMGHFQNWYSAEYGTLKERFTEISKAEANSPDHQKNYKELFLERKISD